MTAPNVGYARLLDHAQEGYVPVLTGRALAIDVERAREVVGRLEAVADEVFRLGQSLGVVRVTPPGADEVSKNAAQQSDRMVMAGREYLRSWYESLVAASNALRQQIDDYARVDEQNDSRA
ncbi:PE domain-containing protein [Pseudonocardia oroxyli]|uniref:Uncharacterized protein n=1 Tax=Pseudonocardia oroxyli TaxID=366584 RepID=A0A1G7VGX2_PSEOR|nr:PE domain-containing protein [Pseudonocardia oroxyli]SDG58984.1 hypothetical protein SAMN05216377_11355 [Pseudonocardia oroxyli]